MTRILNVLRDGDNAEVIEALINKMPMAYAIIDNDYRIHFANDCYVKQHNLPYEELLGTHCYNAYGMSRPCPQCVVREAMVSGRRRVIKRKDIMPDNSVRVMDDYGIPLMRDGKSVRYVLQIQMDRTAEWLERDKREASFREGMHAFSSLIDAKDPYTAQHSMSVRNMALRIAKMMELGPEDIFFIDTAATLHDIGKVRIPLSILNKPAQLSDEEFAVIKEHPLISASMIEGMSGFTTVKDCVIHHHERFDGHGYPHGLRGADIPLGARIIAVADTYDAMTSTRAYRDALSHDVATEEIYNGASTQFDPDVVHAFMLLSQIGQEVERDRRRRAMSHVVERRFPPVAPIIDHGKVMRLSDIITMEELMEKLFAYAPFYYVLLGGDMSILSYSKNYPGLIGRAGDDLFGMQCFAAMGEWQRCVNCPTVRARRSGKAEKDHVAHITPVGKKVMDVYAVPVKYGGEQLVIEIMLDRTEETELTQQREADLHYILHTLSNLLDEEMPDLKSDKITDLAESIALLLGT